MVARISSGANPTGAVCYNEEKVGKGEAERLAVRNYAGISLPIQGLSLATIARQLEERASDNERISKPTFHASLTLAQGEKPSAEELVAIADRYMNGMGYSKQPYVVYQHHDTDHTHVHIVSVRVDENGKKVPDTYERERSNKLRQEIEIEFNLTVAERAALKPERVLLQPIIYGQGNVKKEVSAVVQSVLREFTFSSFSQYNQLLGIYNVKATEVPVTGKKPGLVYSVTDANKTAQGLPYKASSLPFQPTMETVIRRMNAGKKVKGDRVKGVRKVASEQLSQSKGWDDFQQRLSRLGIETIPHLGTGNNLFGISFIDTRSRAIYTGSELGKSFTAGSLKATLGNSYEPPSRRETAQPELRENNLNQTRKQPTKHAQNEHLSLQTEQRPESIPNADLIRQLLYAIGETTGGPDDDQELKTMIKRSRSRNR